MPSALESSLLQASLQLIGAKSEHLNTLESEVLPILNEVSITVIQEAAKAKLAEVKRYVLRHSQRASCIFQEILGMTSGAADGSRSSARGGCSGGIDGLSYVVSSCRILIDREENPGSPRYRVMHCKKSG